MSFRCPWCGSPVTVRGSRWECGWSCSAAFFAKYPVLDAEKLLAAAQGGTEVFDPEFVLSMERLGSFWQALLPQIPARRLRPCLA